MGSPKRVYSDVSIGENAHRSRGIGSTYTETALGYIEIALLPAPVGHVGSEAGEFLLLGAVASMDTMRVWLSWPSGELAKAM